MPTPSSGRHPSKTRLVSRVPAAAGITSDMETVIGVVPGSAGETYTLTGVTYVPDATAAGAASNNRVFSVQNKGPAAGQNLAGASLTHDVAGSLTAFVGKTVTVSGTPANVVCAAGDVLTFKSLHIGTGTTDPGGTVSVELTRS